MQLFQIILLLLSSIIRGREIEYTYDKGEILEKGYSYCQAGLPFADSYSPLYPEGELLSVQLFHRHGDRSPAHLLPHKYQSQDTWDCPIESHQPRFQSLSRTRTPPSLCDSDKGYCSNNPLRKIMWQGSCYMGQLTPIGINQLQNIGNQLKCIYVDQLHFLPDTWDEAVQYLYIRSSDLQRTQQSVSSLLTGFFPSTSSRLSSESKIPMEVFPREIETLYPNPRSCPRLKILEEKFRKSKKYQNLFKSTSELRKLFRESIPQDVTNPNFWTPWFLDTLVSRHCHNMSPLCFKKDGEICFGEFELIELQNVANEESKLWYNAKKNSNKLTRLQIGPILKEIADNVRRVETSNSKDLFGSKLVNQPQLLKYFNTYENIPNPRFKIYSGHDITLGPLLGGLDADLIHWPPYASNLLIEVWKPQKNNTSINNDQLGLRLIYNGENLNTSWCANGTCKIVDYTNYLKRLKIIDDEKEWDYFDECHN